MTNAEQAAAPLLLPHSRTVRKPITDLRQVFNAIGFMLAAGCRQRSLPKCFPPFSAGWNYFYAWRNTGIFERMPDALRRQAGRAADPTAAVDSSPVKTTESGGPSGYDAGKKIKGRKRHISTAADRSPIAVLIHEAAVQIKTALWK